jgi:RNA polymerase sigma-70 factor (ECF subfamily)
MVVLDNPTPGGLSWQNGSATTRRPRTVNDSEADDPTPDEHALLLAAQDGDRQAFAGIVERYWDRLYRWLYNLSRDRHQAEDLTQETFAKVLAALPSFRPGSNFRAWLFRIGHNNFVNLKRAGKRYQPAVEEAESLPGPTAAQSVEDREALAAVRIAVDGLPHDFRNALLLHTQEGLSYREIAAIVKTTEETARWRVYKARQKLLKVLHPDLLPPGSTTETQE